MRFENNKRFVLIFDRKWTKCLYSKKYRVELYIKIWNGFKAEFEVGIDKNVEFGQRFKDVEERGEGMENCVCKVFSKCR